MPGESWLEFDARRRLARRESRDRSHAAQKAWRQSDRGKDQTYRKKYGISLAEVRLLFQQQGGLCANNACSQPLSFEPEARYTAECASVDHDHHTQKVRGLLCRVCNLAIGYAQDSPNILRGLATYLEIPR